MKVVPVVVGGLIGFALVGLIAYRFWIIPLNLIGGFLLYLAIARPLDSLERRGIPRWQASVMMILAGSILLFAVLLYVSIPLFEELTLFGSRVPQLVDDAEQRLAEVETAFPYVRTIIEAVRTKFVESISEFVRMSGTLLTTLVTVPIIAAIFLHSRRTLRRALLTFIPNEYFEVSVTIGDAIVKHIQEYVLARGLETVAVTVLYALGFFVIGLPQGLFLALLGGVLNIIPYLGPLITIIPIGLVAYIAGGASLFWQAMIVLGMVRLMDDAVLQTGVVARVVAVHPLMVILVTLLGEEVLGVVGMIIAIPVYVITKVVLKGFYQYVRAVQRHEVILAKIGVENSLKSSLRPTF